MAEKTENKERRRHRRSPVTSGVTAFLMTSAQEVIGSVSDISMGGVKVTFHNPDNREIDYTDLTVDLISGDCFVAAIPCSNAWDCPVENDDFTASGDLRQCGIRFVSLNPNQLYLLRNFISRCAVPEINPQPQPEIPARTSL
ncbi:MAG: hypothetical protein AMJ60_01615 [Desulfobacterales bacterium SG8_35]|nr:MAG: hypothetical protein AMJ60_01615 [Desulfobacterales bacterium SG8_35]